MHLWYNHFDSKWVIWYNHFHPKWFLDITILTQSGYVWYNHFDPKCRGRTYAKNLRIYAEKNFHTQFSDKTAFLVRSWVGFEVEIVYALIRTEQNIKQLSHRKTDFIRVGKPHGFKASRVRCTLTGSHSRQFLLLSCDSKHNAGYKRSDSDVSLNQFLRVNYHPND